MRTNESKRSPGLGQGSSLLYPQVKEPPGGIEQEQAGNQSWRGSGPNGSDRGRENVRWAGLTLLGEIEVPVWVHGWVDSFKGRVGQGEASSSPPMASL